MAVVAGTCEFSEANGRARVFALCELQDKPVLTPVSMAGETSIRGMRCIDRERRLVFHMSRLPSTMIRAYIGLRINRNLDLSRGGPYSLNLKLDSGEVKSMSLQAPPPDLGNRYALMAVMTRTGDDWNVGRLVAGTEFYVDRPALSAVRPVPPWWTRHA